MCDGGTASEGTRCRNIMMETKRETEKNRQRGKCGVCLRKREKQRLRQAVENEMKKASERQRHRRQINREVETSGGENG